MAGARLAAASRLVALVRLYMEREFVARSFQVLSGLVHLVPDAVELAAGTFGGVSQSPGEFMDRLAGVAVFGE
jgi:hypothetical protein